MKDVVFSGRNGEIEETIKDRWPGEQSCTSDNRTSPGCQFFIFLVSLHTHFLQVDIIKGFYQVLPFRVNF